MCSIFLTTYPNRKKIKNSVNYKSTMKWKGRKKKIEIIKSGSYLPKNKVTNEELEKMWNLEQGYIKKRTGIENRYIAIEEKIEKLAWKAIENIKITQQEKEKIGLIVTATTTTKLLMPGISNEIQKKLGIKTCICLDILAGCAGYINALDIAKMYLEKLEIQMALVIGVDKLSEFTNPKDINTAILLGDGAGAVLFGKSEENKKYTSLIQAESENNEILTCKTDKMIQMNGTKIYKYAVTKTVENIKQLLEKTQENLEDIKYVIPHQSNQKIMNAITSRLGIEDEKMYTNIVRTGNTFCASIPIAIDEIIKENLLNKGDKVILLGYGGGLNTGSVLLEI